MISGGFLPKEPIDNNYFYDSYHTMKHIVDITTDQPITPNLIKISGKKTKFIINI